MIMTMAHILTLLFSFTLTTTALPTNQTIHTSFKPSASPVPFGHILDHCTVPGTVALTFDDGPYMFTAGLLDVLAANDAPCTFFLNGGGLGGIYQYPDVVHRIWAEGHQLASHTWDHVSLPGMDRDSLTAQMTELEDAFVQIIGAFPVYMRPPYLHHDAALLQAMSEMGYHIITAGIDTKDYENDSPDLIGNSLALFRAGLDAGGTIILAHDVHQQTVDNLVQAMLDEIRARGLRAVTIGDCLGDLRDEWYRASR